MKYCRMLGDMTLVYKILCGDNQSLCNLLKINDSRTRGHNFNLYKPLVSIRVINNWNSFPYEVVYAGSLDSFKSKLDSTWKDKVYVS